MAVTAWCRAEVNVWVRVKMQPGSRGVGGLGKIGITLYLNMAYFQI